mgnify:CR=1 FL=1
MAKKTAVDELALDKLATSFNNVLQKGAFFFQKNCIPMSDQTEWVELIENNVNVLVGVKGAKIKTETERMLAQQTNFDVDLYGNGKACQNIVNEILALV